MKRNRIPENKKRKYSNSKVFKYVKKRRASAVDEKKYNRTISCNIDFYEEVS